MINYRIIPTCLLLIVTLISFSSCSDSDNEPSVENTIKMDGVALKETTVTLLGVSIDDEGHAGITFTTTDGSLTKVLTVDFEYSPSASLTGTYSFPASGNDRLLDDWLTNYSEFNGTSEMTSTNLESGTVTLEDLGGSRYSITINLTMNDGKVFQGTYKGSVTAVFNNG
jgi:hypothetical protein